MLTGNAWRIGRIAGIELRVDASWSIIAVLIAVSFFGRIEVLYDLETVPAISLAVVSALAFFMSVLLHEFAHALTSKARGIEVAGITLFLFGGATEAKVESREPKDEFLITIVGPLTSLLIAAGLGVVAALIGDPAGPIGGMVGYLAWINLALAVFNLLPGLPLDGGRVLRSAVWAATDDLSRATRIAARAGQILGYALIGLGVLSLLSGAFGGLWIAAIGWFLSQAAQASYLQQQLGQAIAGVTAADVMTPTERLVSVPGHITVQDAVENFFLRYDHSAFPVERDGEAVGLLTLRTVRRLSPEERRSRTVADCMTDLGQVSAVPRREPLQGVVERFEDGDLHRVLVVDDGTIEGIVTPHDVARWLRRREELGIDLREAGEMRDVRARGQ